MPLRSPLLPVEVWVHFRTGFGYASWMLGDYTATNQPAPTEPHYGSQAWDVYAQDSWKITRKLTLDYGLRWDLETPQHEEYGRLGQFSETAANQQCRRPSRVDDLRQHLRLLFLPEGLSLRDWPPDRNRVSDQR